MGMLISLRSRQPGESSPRFDSDRYTLLPATEYVGWPASRLTNDNPTDKWKAWGQRNSHTRILFVTAPLGDDKSIDIASMVGVNRELPNVDKVFGTTHTENKFRVVIDSFLSDTTQPAVSSSNFVLTNLTGAYSILNQPINPPEGAGTGHVATHLTAVSPTADTEVSLRFDHLTGTNRPLKAGTNIHTIMVHVRNSANVATFPIIVGAKIIVGGVTGSTLTAYEVEKTSEGYIYKYYVNGLGGSTAELGLIFTGLTTGSSTVEPIAAQLRIEVDNLLYDSGWISPSSNKYACFPAHAIPAGEIRIVMIEFSDFSSILSDEVAKPGGGTQQIKIYTPLAPPFTGGRLIVSPAIDIPLQAEQGFTMRKSGDMFTTRTFGGFPVGSRNPFTWWEADYIPILTRQSEIFGQLEELFASVGFSLTLLFIPDPASISSAIYGMFSAWDTAEAGQWVDATGNEYRYDFKFSAVEAFVRRRSIG